MTNSEQAIREFAQKWATVWFNAVCERRSNADDLISDLTALISEGYYPKEFVRWKDKKDLRYSSLHNRYYSDTDNGMREFTLDELFNYWEENER